MLQFVFLVVSGFSTCQEKWQEAFVRFEKQHGHRLARILKEQHNKLVRREVHFFDGHTDKYVHSYICVKNRQPIIVDLNVTRKRR